MISLLAFVPLFFASPLAKVPAPVVPPEQKAPPEARALAGVTAEGLTVFELEQVAGAPEASEELRFYSVHDTSGARVALFRKEQQEGTEKVKDPDHLWDTARPVEEGAKWLAAHPLEQPEEVNLLLDEPGQPAAGGTLLLKKQGKGCDAALQLEAPSGARTLLLDSCRKGEGKLPLVQAVVQVLRTRAGALLVLARVTRLRPSSQEDVTLASRLHFVRLDATSAAPQK